MGPQKLSAKSGGQSGFKISCCVCHCFAPCPYIASCHCFCCHDPFIVMNLNLSTTHWFHSACTSVSMFTINVNNRLFSAPLISVLLVCVPELQSPSSCSVGSMVSRMPILQTCTVVVAPKQRLVLFQHLHSSSLLAPS